MVPALPKELGRIFFSMADKMLELFPRGILAFTATSNKHSEPMEEFWDDTAYSRGEPTTFSRDGVTRNGWHKYSGPIYDDDVWSTQYLTPCLAPSLQAPVQFQRVFPHHKECTYQPLHQLYRQDLLWAILDIPPR
ncbi:hypothetical protein JTB14_034801 [Gonioctena quinquepunctata]|nr:hypothetical protein JTB14_034801 [Gonioctena quinquepunctata]